MKSEDFEQLKDFILSKNGYFAEGYANAFKAADNAIVVNAGSDMKRIFPLDTAGNYYYLRSETAIKHEAKHEERLADNGSQKLVLKDVLTCYLIAIVRHADVFDVLENLKNTVMQYKAMQIVPVSSTWNREQVVKEELSGTKKEEITAAIQRLKTETIVKMTLHVSKIFIPGHCINDI